MNIDPNKIKEVHGTDQPQLVEIVYGDSVTGESLIKTNEGEICIDILFNTGTPVDKSHPLYISGHSKEYVSCDKYVYINNTEMRPIKYIMRHLCILIYNIVTESGKSIKTTANHSLCTTKGSIPTCELTTSDYLCTIHGDERISSITEEILTEPIYVYDICVDTNVENEHRFVANGFISKNTDSLYISWQNLINTIEGSEKWTDRQKTEFLVRLSNEFLNQHNKEFMTEYYRSRNARNVDTDMVHEFELETCCISGVWLDVKKRYGQLLTYKDGKYYDEGEYPLKVKGLEIVKASFPAPARKILKNLMNKLLAYDGSDLIHILNKMMQEGHAQWMKEPVEAISPSISVNNYTKYIISDDNPDGIECQKATPFAVRGLAYYNWLRQTKNLPGDPLYGGKLKYYIVKEKIQKRKQDPDTIFTFQPSELPSWAEGVAPIDREAMFEKCVLDPFNRILNAIGMKQLSASGYIQIDLFDLL